MFSTGGMKIFEPRGLTLGYSPPTATIARTRTGAWIVRGGGPRRRYRTRALARREQERREPAWCRPMTDRDLSGRRRRIGNSIAPV